MSKPISLHLYRDESEQDYCGSYHVPCPDGDPRIANLEAANCGRGRDEDGNTFRSFFFMDELKEMIARAERETECYVVARLADGTEVYI